jgi:hypothetical protein
LHDVGHTPYSHSGEDLLPPDEHGKPIKHEVYSIAIIRTVLAEILDSHKDCASLGIDANIIAGLIEGKGVNRQVLLWKDIISGQIDADWPAPGSEDTKLGVLMEREVRHGASEVYARVQA